MRTRASTTTADRYYDPEVARFIQADSTVPDPEFSQAYNRYAYVYNNPLKFTDPTGQFPFAFAFAAIQSILAAEVTVMGVTMAAWQVGLISGTVNAIIAGATGGNPLTGFAAGFVGAVMGANWGIIGAIAGGAVGSAIQGGDPLMGAITAGVAAICSQTPIASVFDVIEDEYLKALAMSTTSGALAGGVTAEMFGGDFGQGAAYGAAGAAASYVITRSVVDFYESTKQNFLNNAKESIIQYSIDKVKASVIGKLIDLEKMLHGGGSSGTTGYDIDATVTEMDLTFEASGFGSSILNNDAVNGMIVAAAEKAVVGLEYQASKEYTGTGMGTSFDLSGGWEGSLTDISLDVYSGPSLLRGRFYAAPGFMHSNKTTFTFNLRVKVSVPTLRVRLE